MAWIEMQHRHVYCTLQREEKIYASLLAKKLLTRHFKRVTILFYICWVLILFDHCLRFTLRDWDKTQTLVDITEPKCDMTGLSGRSQWRLSANLVSAGSMCAPNVFQFWGKWLESRIWKQAGPWCDRLGTLCAAGRLLRNRDMRDLPSAQLFYFQVLGTLSTEAVHWRSLTICKHCSNAGCQDCLKYYQLVQPCLLSNTSLY